MKNYGSLILILLMTTAVFAAKLPSGTETVSAAGFYNKTVSALKIKKPELRALELIDIIDSCPERTERLYPIIYDTLKRSGITPAISNRIEKTLEKHPDDLLINMLLTDYNKKSGLAERLKRLLRNAPDSGLSELQERSVMFFNTLLLQYCVENEKCTENYDFFLTQLNRFSNEKNLENFYLQILGLKLDLCRQIIWENEYTAPGCPRWQRLPVRGVKKVYLHTLEELQKLENSAEYPHSLELLRIYVRHSSPRSVIYAKRFTSVADSNLIFAILAAAQQHKTVELVDCYLPIFVKADNALPFIANIYAQSFKKFELLQKVLPQQEFELVKATVNKDFTTAEKMAKVVLDGKKKPSIQAVRAIIDLIWHTKNIPLLAKTFELIEKNPQLCDTENANALAYTSAVLGYRIEKTVPLAEFALKQLPDNAAILDTMAYICFKMGNFAKARRYITAALKKIEPGSKCASLYLHAADIELAATKDKKRASELLRRAELVFSDHPDDNEYDRIRAAALQEILKK